MKRSKIKFLSLALAVMLALALAVMLVACNPNNDNNSSTTPSGSNNPNNDDNNDAHPDWLGGVLPEDQFNALINYFYSSDLKGDGMIMSSLLYFSADVVKNQKDILAYYIGDQSESINFKAGCVVGFVEVQCGEYDDTTHEFDGGKTFAFFAGSSAEEATKGLKAFAGSSAHVSTVGNVAVFESEEGLYENQVLKATLPSSVSEARKQVLKDGFARATKSYYGRLTFNISQITEEEKVTAYDGASFELYPYQGNCLERLDYGYCGDDTQSEIDYFEEEKKFYTADSYCNVTKEAGYVFSYEKYKPGFYYEESGDDEVRISGFYTDSNTVDELVVPATLDGKQVGWVYMDCSYLDIKKITLENGIWGASMTDIDVFDLEQAQLPASLNTFSVSCNTFKTGTATWPKTLESLSIECDSLTTFDLPNGIIDIDLKCPALKTINFDGLTDDFEKTYGDDARNRWCHISDWDPEIGENKYTDITFTVICDNGQLFYSYNSQPSGN